MTIPISTLEGDVRSTSEGMVVIFLRGVYTVL